MCVAGVRPTSASHTFLGGLFTPTGHWRGVMAGDKGSQPQPALGLGRQAPFRSR